MNHKRYSGPKRGDILYASEITLRDVPRPASRSPVSSIASSDGRSASDRLRTPDGFAVVEGLTLNDYGQAIVDFCAMTVTVIDRNGSRIKTLKRLLRMEKVKYRSLDKSHPLHASTIRLRTPDDLHVFLCKIGRRY